MKIKEINTTATIAWSPDVIPLLATGSIAGAVDLDFSSSATLELWDVFGPFPETPIFSAPVENKFYALAWLRPFDGHPRGALVGALETGALHFWDVDTLIKSRSLQNALFHSSTKHTGPVKCLLFNPLQPHVLASGGPRGEIFIWDLKTLADPFTPGRPMTPMDEISCVAWNNAVSHILASTSNAGYTSIWDLKSKREVLHLSYAGALGRADFSYVAWHPTQLTKLITASQSDACPLIMSWDLRNATEPEKILQGHTKGVLSLDWCALDENLLISSGKDNSTRLWNPISGIKLGDYPTAANWAFSTKFAPRAPDVIATASFDGKVVIQTLQDTSPPISEKVKANDDNEFWSNIATTDTQRAVFEVSQAPQWLKRPCTASFGFGSKLVVVKNDGQRGSVNVTKFVSDSKAYGSAQSLSAALKADSFLDILASKIENPGSDSADWEALQKLQKFGAEHFFQTIVDGLSIASEPEPVEIADEESFFSNLSKDIQTHKAQNPTFVPSGPFALISDAQSSDSRLIKLLLANKISDAVSVCLEEGKLMEAMVLALNLDASVKDKVKNRFFEQTNDDVLARVIYSASTQSIVDVVANADISNWKEIASSISAYCKDKIEFNAKIVELGDRVMANYNPQTNADAKNNALMCYLAGNALDKVSAIWLSELSTMEQLHLNSSNGQISSPFDAKFLALTNFVEKLSVYKSIAQLSGPLSGPSIEPVCKAVFEFSNMAASGGLFELADQSMAFLPDDFAGLRTEKERIAKASETPKKNGQTRYNTRASKAPYPPASPNIASRRASAMSTTSTIKPRNPYVPAAGASGPYSYVPEEPQPAFGRPVAPRNNSFGGPKPVTLIAPSAMPITPAMNQSQSFNGFSATAPPVTPGNGNYKVETEGWNDLPETFKPPKPSARRAQPLAAVVQSPVLAAASPVPPVQVPKRGQPAVPPPPKVVSRTPSSRPMPATPRAVSSPKSNKYAPANPTPTQNGHASNGLPSPKTSGPPKNPYAPKVAPTPKTSYATPPANNFVAPPTLSRAGSQLNPYSPSMADVGASINGALASSGPLLSRQASHSIVPPPPPIARVPTLATPPRVASLHQQPAAALPPPPRAASLSRIASPGLGANAGQNSAPVSRQYAPQNQYAPVHNVPQSPGPYAGAPPPTQLAFGAPKTPALSGQAFPPPVKSGPSSSAVPPPPSAYAPSSVSTPQTFAPPSAPPVKAPSVSAPPISAPPISAPPVSAPPVSAPPVSAPPVSAPPVSAPPISAPVAAPNVPTTAASAAPASLASESKLPESIQTSFGEILAHIKPAAPPKYAKHVADMEKRLNILFDHLKKNELLSQDSIGLLHQVADALTEKKFSEAAQLTQKIQDRNPQEAGTWHTGVKRLVTMAEAFDA